MKLFIGNVSYNTSEESLKAFFEEFGPLLSVKIATDRDTGRSRGFAFIEFEDRSKAEQAIQTLNGATLDGKALVVNEARPREGGSSGPRRSGGNRFGGERDNRGGGAGRSSSRGGYSGGGRW